MNTTITSEKFGQALADAGVIADASLVRRIVIDAEAGKPLMVYVEYFGDSRWLDVARFVGKVEVITSSANGAEQASR
jgi:hypothetical protein